METLTMLAIRTYKRQAAATIRKTFSGRLHFFIITSCGPSQHEEMHGVQHSKSAEGGTRTHTSLRRADFKSAASAIPPPRQEVEAASGVEPLYRGFADPRLNHLATPP